MDAQQWTAVGARRAAGLAGLAAVLAYLGLAWLFRTQFGVLSLIEITQTGLLKLIPGDVFSATLDLFTSAAKPLLFVTLLVAILLVGGVVGRLWGQLRSAAVLAGGWRAATEGLLVGMVVYLFLALLWMPGFGAGFFGLGLGAPPLLAVAGQLVPCLGYGLGLGLLAPWLARRNASAAPPAGSEPTDAGRRRLLVAGGAALVAVVAGGGWYLSQLAQSATAGARGGLARLSPAVTPIGVFYKVSKNFFDPIVDQGSWRLEIGGLVERPYRLTIGELQALPATTDYNTLMCISNEVGGSFVGNAEWTGTSLRGLLEQAGVMAGAVDLKFTCADDYTDSIPLAKALEADTRLVYRMNGLPLPDDHGAPARLVVPGIYGMKNVKWVRKIELVATDYQGFWQTQGWDDAAPYKLFSKFDVPSSNEIVPLAPLALGGVAFSGDRGIARVEVSPDAGRSWLDAVVEPALGSYSWVRWTFEWRPPEAGQYQFQVRAWDQKGNRQTAQRASPFPSGASGYHTVLVTVRA